MAISDEVRTCLREVASTVTILSAGRGDGVVVMTATAFTPVSLEPVPTVLVCVNRAARLHAAAVREGGFRINVLRHDQAAAASTCSGGDMADRLRAADWRDDGAPGPRLGGCLFDFACRTVRTITQGEHSIFIGEVLDVARGGGAPLLYARGAYAVLATDPPPAA
ncbi:MAG: flavin reductase family protein [Pseudomonadota bacterium]